MRLVRFTQLDSNFIFVFDLLNDVYINWMDCWNGNGSQKMGPIFRHFGRSGHAQ